MKRISLLLGIFQILTIVSACAPRVAIVEKPEVTPARIEKPPVSAKEAWEVEWEKTLNLARKEGVVTIGSTRGEFIRAALSKVLKEKFGIDIIWIPINSQQLIAKMKAERNVGIYSLDIFNYGTDSLIQLKREGLLQSLRSALILPEVKDDKAWLGGKLPFIDNEEEYVFAANAYPTDALHANTKLVPNYKEEFASYYDLLKPKWKGKILAVPFIRSGGGQKWFNSMVEEDFGPILGLDFMRALANQELQIIEDRRLAAEWILKAKYPVGLNLPIGSQLTEWMRQGISVPVDGFTPKEGSYVSTGGGAFVFIQKAPHPNTAKVFLNWLFTREGQIFWSKFEIKQSTRIDIPEPKEIDPLIIARDPKLNYPKPDQEKYLLKTQARANLAEEIFGHLLK